LVLNTFPTVFPIHQPQEPENIFLPLCHLDVPSDSLTPHSWHHDPNSIEYLAGQQQSFRQNNNITKSNKFQNKVRTGPTQFLEIMSIIITGKLEIYRAIARNL